VIHALTIEVHDSGLDAAKNEIAVFLAHESTRTDTIAPLAYVVLRKLLIQVETAERKQLREQKAREAAIRQPSIKELRRKAA
jgi:hypothetical protein